MSADKIFLTADEAAAELNISKTSLYAYVSRGLVRSEPGQRQRQRLYHGEDVRALRAGKEKRRSGESAAVRQLSWETPVLDSSITDIGPEGLFYRGRDACALAASSSVESVASLLWGLGDSDPFAAPIPPAVSAACDAATKAAQSLSPLERCQAVLPFVAAADPGAYTQRGAAAAPVAARLLRTVCAALVGTPLSSRRLTQVVADGLGVDAAHHDLVRMALVLCADHELNVSTFTVRSVMSAGASLYAGIIAGLSAFQGYRHGGASERARLFIDEALTQDDLDEFLKGKQRRGEPLPGFGHPLYPQGDIRAAYLIEALSEHFGDRPAGDAVMDRAHQLIEVVYRASGFHPNIDLGVALLTRLLGLPTDASLVIFATGRCVGWLAHALEQVETGSFIRPRARYIGVRPSPEKAVPRRA
ncbi:MAG: citrate synthase family protein [Proteobacteria bacterium]|nr:citrate synthase family protein [Pseudomonadota bacterium]